MTVEKLNTSGYDRVIALDTQMVFEARPLAQLNWSELSQGPILLIVLPQVSAEVDARKRDGRLGQRARELNRLIEPSIEDGQPNPLIESPIRVDIAYVPSANIDWSKLEDLERDNNDDRIVAQAINALVDDPTAIEVMSFDSRPRAGARRHGLKALKPDESWLLAQEPSPGDRRIAELEQQVNILKMSEPKLEIAIKSLSDFPLTRLDVAPLPSNLIEPIAKMILSKNPHEGRRSFGYDILLNPNYDDQYEEYAEAVQQSDVPNLHVGLGRLFSQFPFEVTIRNVGALTAENVTVEMRSGNARVHSAPFMVNILGREPPSTDRSFPSIPAIGERLRTDRAFFYLEEADDPTIDVEYRCQDFRHGRTQSLAPVLELTDRAEAKAHFEVRVTASNMRGEVVERCIVPLTKEEAQIGELVQLDELVLRKAPPVWQQLSDIIRRDEDGLIRFNNDGTITPR